MPALANARGTVPAQHCIAQPCRRSGVLRQHSLGHTGASSIANAGSNVLRGSRQRSGFRVSAAAGPSDKKPVQLPVASNPTEAVELGTQLFKEGKAAQAVQLFTSALGMNPNEDEARAALYNRACANTKLAKYDDAAKDLRRAVDDYRLKFNVILKDPDLAGLIERPEFEALTDELAGGVSKSVDQQVKLRTEAKNPFRFARLFLYGGITMGGGIGAIVLAGRLARAVNGGDDAPDVVESAGNLAVNLGVMALLSWLFIRELKTKEKQESVVAREEELGRLLVELGPGRTVPISRLRTGYRPVIFSGSRGYVRGVMRAAEPYKRDLQKRGVLLVPVTVEEEETKPRGFAPKAAPTALEGMVTGQVGDGDGMVARTDDRWKVLPVDTERWTRWVDVQREVGGLTGADGEEGLYVAVALDGTVRRSGRGAPNWEVITDEYQTLDAVATKLTGV